jgi:hypothetical protein
VTKEIERQTFLDDMLFLRVRNLTLRCLASAAEIACASESNSQDIKQHNHNHQNSVGPVINGEVKDEDISVTHYETFAKISDELLNLYKSLTANPPAQVPQVRDTYFVRMYYVCLDFSGSFFTCHSALSLLEDR